MGSRLLVESDRTRLCVCQKRLILSFTKLSIGVFFKLVQIYLCNLTCKLKVFETHILAVTKSHWLMGVLPGLQECSQGLKSVPDVSLS